MGIALSDIPAVGTLLPAERRDLARWLRTHVARGARIQPAVLQAALDESPYAPVRCAELVSVGWLLETPEGLHADTYERRVAAGAVDGTRMSPAQVHELARDVAGRVAQLSGLLGGVRINCLALYGSAVRSSGNTKPDVGDLDLAIDIDVLDPALTERLTAVSPAQRWREAIVESGWAEHLMQGDDRITLAGSLARVLALFNRQVNRLDIPADGRLPALLTLWSRGTLGAQQTSPPALTEGDYDELVTCPADLLQTLRYVQYYTLATQPRAQQLLELLSHPVKTRN